MIGKEANRAGKAKGIHGPNLITGHPADLLRAGQGDAGNTQVPADGLPGDLSRAGHQYHHVLVLPMAKEDGTDHLARFLPALQRSLFEGERRGGMDEKPIGDMHSIKRL